MAKQRGLCQDRKGAVRPEPRLEVNHSWAGKSWGQSAVRRCDSDTSTSSAATAQRAAGEPAGPAHGIKLI